MCLITVIICTFNRAEILDETLKSWLSVEATCPDVELLVVDNNSTDYTQQVVNAFHPQCPNLMRCVFEPAPGLSNARNRGIKEAHGQIVAFVDDDVCFEPNWLVEILKAFSDNPEISCVGGKSIPKFEAPVPAWMTEDLYDFYGSTRSGDHDKIMQFPEHPFGLNMAFRKEVFEQVGDFNITLGRIKNSLLSNEELDFFYRVNKAGLKVFYASKALLYHRIPTDRMDKNWILSRRYWQGISDVVYWQTTYPRNRLILSLKTLLISKKIIILYGRKITNKMFPSNTAYSFRQQQALYRFLGIARQNVLEILPFLKSWLPKID